jgi:hypothetical protein
MERNLDAEAAIITNDLSSMVQRIEMLQANPHYTAALLLVQKAYIEMSDGRSQIHQEDMRRRFAGAGSHGSSITGAGSHGSSTTKRDCG